MRGARPPPREPGDFEPARQTSGWQHQASSRVERQFRDSVRYGRRVGTSARALSERIKSALTRIDPQLSCVLLLRRLRAPLPLSKLSCQRGRSLDPSGHRRAANARAGLFDRPGYAGKRAATKISREGTPRATTSVLDREMDLHARTQSTADDWKWWQTAFSSSRGATWTHVSVLRVLSRLSSLGRGVKLGLWCSRARLDGAGLRRNVVHWLLCAQELTRCRGQRYSGTVLFHESPTTFHIDGLSKHFSTNEHGDNMMTSSKNERIPSLALSNVKGTFIFWTHFQGEAGLWFLYLACK